MDGSLPKPDETTSLLTRQYDRPPSLWSRLLLARVLFCAFLVSLSFGITQIPLLFAFRIMSCEAYYNDHPEPPSDDDFDKCSNRTIEAWTAESFALLGMTTTVFGLVNLFIAGWAIKKIGVKYALLIQVFWPAVRLLVQNIGVMVGGASGIIIVQCSQIVSIIGGPNGYLLTLNTFVTEVVAHELRTGSLGQLAGCMMFGSASGFLVGGLISDAFGILAPFRATFGMFLLSTVYVATALPYVAPPKVESKKAATGLSRFFGPLKTFAPQTWISESGKKEKQFGALFLCCGVFLGVLATGYIPTLLQMYSTNQFEFGTRQNGYLIFMYSMLRGLFLTFAFPRIIKAGRRLTTQDTATKNEVDVNASADPSQPEQVQVLDVMDNEQEPLIQPLTRTSTKATETSCQVESVESMSPSKSSPTEQTYEFDLFYCKFSIFLDGVLTLLATFTSSGWHMYLVAGVLPFGAGTSSASKGTVLQMCPESERTDALAGISLIENMARLSTIFVFGMIFAAFTTIGKTELVFTVNAAIAFLGFTVLLLCRFPPRGSRRADELEVDDAHER